MKKYENGNLENKIKVERQKLGKIKVVFEFWKREQIGRDGNEEKERREKDKRKKRVY